MVPHSKLASKSPNNPLTYRGMPAQKGHNVSPSGEGICNTNCSKDGSESENNVSHPAFAGSFFSILNSLRQNIY